MSDMEYKTVPLPNEPRKYKGLKDPVDRTSRTMTEILNEEARGGWQFVRMERLEIEVRKGMMRTKDDMDVTLLIFGRDRADSAQLSTPARRVEPQPAAVRDVEPATPAPSPAPEPVTTPEPAQDATAPEPVDITPVDETRRD